MNRFSATIVFITLLQLTVSGQINRYGVPKYVNYPSTITHGSEQNWAIVQDQRGVIYVGNNDEGVLEYDGSNWRNIPVTNNGIVRSLAVSDDGIVYVGGVGEIGYLAPDKNGDLYHKKIKIARDSSSLGFGDFWKTYCIKNKVYFYSEKHIIIYLPESGESSIFRNSHHALFGFYQNETFYCGSFSDGLMEFKEDSIMVQAIGGQFYKEEDIFGLTTYDENHLLIGVTGKGLSLYNTTTGVVNSNFAPKETNDFLAENFLSSLSKLKSGNFIATTLGGGFVILNPEGQILELFGKEQGLQDQTIYSSFESTSSCPNSQIWTAMSYGISKVDIGSPIRMFTEKHGFTGLINDINSIGNRLFIGTQLGIFGMTEINNQARFEKIKNIDWTIWDMINFKPNSEKEYILAIGRQGLFQIDEKGNSVNLKKKIKGVKDKTLQEYWGYRIYKDPKEDNRIYLGRETSLTSLVYENGKWHYDYFRDSILDEVRTIARTDDHGLWFGMKGEGIGYMSPLGENAKNYYFNSSNGLPSEDNNYVFNIDGELIIGTTNGIYKISASDSIKNLKHSGIASISFFKDTIYNPLLLDGKNEILRIYSDPVKNIWISYNNQHLGWSITKITPEGKTESKAFFSLEDVSSDAFHSIDGNEIWFPKSNILYCYKNVNDNVNGQFNALVRNIIVNEQDTIFKGLHTKLNDDGTFIYSKTQDKERIPHLEHDHNNIEIKWSAPYFFHEDQIEYSYFLEGFSKDWSEWNKALYQDFTNLSHGSYSFIIKAKNIYQEESETDRFDFIILPPWYLTIWAILGYFIIAIFLIYIIIALYTKRLKNENIRLEGIIQERTTEIRKQKEELTDSIEYASRIQRALLPPEKMLSKHAIDHFTLFKPRDIVSGDFYWFGVKNNKVFIVVADCTGHGVPGAFMSMLGISFLNEIIIKSGIHNTNEILNSLRDHIISSLRQTGRSMDETTRDGMDLAMISIDKETNQLEFSGAYNPLYMVRKLNNSELDLIHKGKELKLEKGSIYNNTHILIQLKGDPMPIGISEKKFNFTSKKFTDPGATYYMFSDGYLDQFGGPMGKKFMSRNFKKLLLEIQNMSFEKQKKKLDDTLINWMGNISQIDDILVIGVKLKE